MPRGPNPGSYANPVRDASVTFGRVDQGVDYSGSGPIHALGPGRIVDVRNSGWPGGTYILEKLTAGPNAGNYWYAAENITPNVRIGEQVTTNTVIGTLNGGMETGWGAPPPLLGESLAHLHGHFAFPTPEGTEAERMLRFLGAPGPNSGPGPTGPKPKNVHTTSFLSSLFGSFFSADTLERFGLIVFGGLLILVGIWLLAGKQTINLATTVAAPEAKAASKVT